MAPVELVGFTWREAQWNVDLGRGGAAVLSPSASIAAHCIVTAFVAAPTQFLEYPD